MSDASPPLDGLQAREQLLDAAAVDGVDVTAARSRVAELRQSRDRSRRRVLGGLAALLLAAGLAWALVPGDDPDELVADRDEPTTTTSSTSSTTAPVASPGTDAPAAPTTAPVTVQVATSTTTPTSTAPPTTIASNQPLRAQLRVLTPVVRAGEVATIEVAWIDADHIGGDPVLVSDWGDPAVHAGNPTTGPAGTCDGPGVSAGGSARQDFRYATTGAHRVQVTLTTCDGRGPFAERVTLDAPITVTDPRLGDAPAAAVVATSSPGQPEPPPLDSATAELVPQGTPEEPFAIPAREPVLDQRTATGPATVLRLPTGAVGTVRLTWSGSACVATATVDLGSPSTAVPVLVLTSTC